MKTFTVMSASRHATYLDPRAPLVLDSPHSGTIYPRDFHFVCPLPSLRQAEDTYVDELFSAATAELSGRMSGRVSRLQIGAYNCRRGRATLAIRATNAATFNGRMILHARPLAGMGRATN